MKKLITTTIFAALAVIGSTIMAQEQPDEYLGLPGDNLNLYAVMNLFQNSETIEGFERSLNDENSRINNLDLNGDNLIDYIRVTDYVDDNVHTIVLQAVLGRKESQDVGVFTVERFRDGSVQIQLIGDELLYGRNYIIEPLYAETPNPGYTGRQARENGNVVRTTYVEVAAWPVVRYIFLPNYSIWRSSWYWGYYPRYWNPWRPYYWHYYYGYHYNWYPDYYNRYHRWDHHRYAHWNDFYYNGHRTHSRNVSMRINEGNYRTTYSHPEQRQEGEAHYARLHPDRPSSISSGNNTSRRSGSEAGSNREPAGNNTGTTTRRSGTSVTNRSGANTSGNGNTGTSRRSTTTGSNRSETTTSAGENKGSVRRSGTTVKSGSDINSKSGQNEGTTRRSTTTATDRKESAPSSSQSSGTTRRSTTTVTERSVNRPETAPRTESSRTSKQSNTSVSSSNRRSNVSSKKETTIRQGSKSSNTESTKTSRRK